MKSNDQSTQDPPSGNVVDVTILGENSVSPETVELQSGQQIRWTNQTASVCTVTFAQASVFEGNVGVYQIPPGSIVLSNAISQSAPPTTLSYEVSLGLESLSTPPLNPTVIIRHPHEG